MNGKPFRGFESHPLRHTFLIAPNFQFAVTESTYNRQLAVGIGNTMSDDKLAIDEARRAAQHESVKSQVEGEVQSEIGERAARKLRPVNRHR